MRASSSPSVVVRVVLAAAVVSLGVWRWAAPPPTRAEAPPTEESALGAGDQGSGKGRFKDPGVYVDGRPVAVLSFGELPWALAPVWGQDQVSAPKGPGEEGPGWAWAKVRRYRFLDYLAALGVDLARVRELHVHGPKASEVLVVQGDQLRGPKGRELMFRFGGEVFGKPIPVVPLGVGNGRSPDKITAVALYVERKAPTLVRNVGLTLDGEPVTGIPYHGEPLRGGVRVYLDDRLAAVLKRRQLEGEGARGAQGRFGLAAVLGEQGVDVGQVAEGWLVHRDQRATRLTPEQLRSATLRAQPHRGGAELVVGEATLPLQALMLYGAPLALARADEPQGR